MPPGEETVRAVELFVALLTAAAFVSLLVRRIAVPYTVALVVLGLAAAIVVPQIDVVVTPELVLAVLLPGLVFDAAYRIEWRELRSAFGGVALLAVPGVLLVATIVAAVLHLVTELPLELGFVVGAMVAATDPAAVIATFKRLNSPRRLATLVEGESLFNDGTSLVIFVIAVRAITSGVSAADALIAFVATLTLSALIGAVVGLAASRVVATVDDHLIELSFSVATAYGAYLIADALHESGIIATVVAGIVLGNYGRRIGMTERTEEALDTVWEFIAFLLTALVFLLVGLAISLPELLDSLPAITAAVAAILAGRALVVYGALGGASRLLRTMDRRRPEPAGVATMPPVAIRHPRPIPLAWRHVTFWAGLRGAVSVAMALSLPLDFPERALLQEITFGVVLFTLLVQGTTSEFVIQRTGAGADTSDAEVRASL